MKTFTPLTNRIQTITRSLGLGPAQDALCPRATMLGRHLALPLFFVGAALLVQPCAAIPFQWEYTGSLNTGRNHHTAILLSDGRVLVAGGGYGPLASAELYDPATGTWTYTGSLNTARVFHTATLLSNGEVLVVGGEGNTGGSLASAELYDPSTGTWTVTGSLNTGRYSHTATLLSDGRVLVVGGNTGYVLLASAELYDPATGIWTYTGSLNTAQSGHTATLLSDGEVLVAGGGPPDVLSSGENRRAIVTLRPEVYAAGGYLASAELYDPATGTWTDTGSLNTARAYHTATLLADGRVLVAGGEGIFDLSRASLASAEVYDPATGTWTVTGELDIGRYNHTATLLSDGEVLVAGGYNLGNDSRLASVQLYDPASGTWTPTGSLNTGRSDHTATLLPNGEVLVAGGFGSTVPPELASAELYDPGIVSATKVDGSGSIENNQGNEVTFRFSAAQADDSSRLGQFTFCDTAAGKCTARARVESLSITGNSASFSGQARLDGGTRVTFSVSVTDNGEPGTSDTISITLSNGYSVSGTLTSGDIRIQ